MSSGLTSTLSDFSRTSEFPKSPLAGEPAASGRRRGPSFLAGLGTGIKRLFGAIAATPRKLVSSPFIRYLFVFALGAAAMVAWQSYGTAARRSVAALSPRLAFLAPAPAAGITSEQVKATSRALAAVHQSVDKLSSEIDRLETQGSADTIASSSPPRRASRR